MVAGDEMISLMVSNVDEIVWTPESPKLEFPADVYIGRAGKNLRFRKLRSLLELGSDVNLIGIVTEGEKIDLATSDESAMRFLTMRQVIGRLQEITQEKIAAGFQLITLVVDVSCLPRGEQGALFAALGELACQIEIRLAIGYSLSRYMPPPQKWARSVTPVAPVHASFAGWGDPFMPIHVVVGLGYEAGKAFGVVQYLEPAHCTPLMPVSPEERFLVSVEKQNHDFLKRHPHPLRYEVMQPARTYLSLMSVLSGILRDHRAILLPFGPKILFTLSLLAGLVHPQVSVWYVEGEDNQQSDEGSPSGHAALLTCNLAVYTKPEYSAESSTSWEDSYDKG